LTDLEKPKIRENEPETSDSIKSEGTGREQIEENGQTQQQLDFRETFREKVAKF
jgi:hypothetical protein